jgi:hypothetical protein
MRRVTIEFSEPAYRDFCMSWAHPTLDDWGHVTAFLNRLVAALARREPGFRVVRRKARKE